MGPTASQGQKPGCVGTVRICSSNFTGVKGPEAGEKETCLVLTASRWGKPLAAEAGFRGWGRREVIPWGPAFWTLCPPPAPWAGTPRAREAHVPAPLTTTPALGYLGSPGARATGTEFQPSPFRDLSQACLLKQLRYQKQNETHHKTYLMEGFQGL